MSPVEHRWVIDPTGAVAADALFSDAMYVEVRRPSSDTTVPPALLPPALLPPALLPVVLVHGGGGQGTDWGTTPDGRPGWADLLVERGHVVYVVDRPRHGRSPGRTAAPAAVAMTARVFASGGAEHTQWPGPGGADDPAVRILAASATGLPDDLAAAQDVERRLLEVLLEDVGRAVLIAHSLGSCAAWLVAERRPDLVAAVVAVEPAGPPYLDVPGTPLRLPDGITAAPLWDGDSAAGLASVPVVIVEGEQSPMSAACGPVAGHLRAAGVGVDHVVLADHGLRGNGHGLILERNNRAVLDLVLTRIGTGAAATDDTHDHTASHVGTGDRS